MESFLVANPWVAAYGPIFLVVAMTLVVTYFIRLIRNPFKFWPFELRDGFLGASLLWSSLGLAMGNFLSDVARNAADNHLSYIWFFLAWGALALAVFGLHGAYDRPTTELVGLFNENIAEDAKKADEKTVRTFQLWMLSVLANLIALVAFFVYDYFIVNAWLG